MLPSSSSCDLTSARTAALPFLAPGCLLVPELHVGDVAVPADEIERGARPVGTNQHSEWVGASFVVPVLDHDAVELHGGSGHAKLERTVRVLAVDADLVVVHPALNLLGPKVVPGVAPLR